MKPWTLSEYLKCPQMILSFILYLLTILSRKRNFVKENSDMRRIGRWPMKLVKNEKFTGCQLHNQQMISRMIMRNEWRTNRLRCLRTGSRVCDSFSSPLRWTKGKIKVRFTLAESQVVGWTLYLLYYRLRYNGIGRINARLVALFFRLFTNIR